MSPLPNSNIMLGIGPDLVNPTVVVTSPAAGSYQTRTINLQATASDDRGVVGVQYQVDGVNVGAEVTSGGTWTLAYDTSALADGDHTVQAVARDAAGRKTTSLPVTMHVANPNTAAITTLGTFNGPGSGGSRRAYGATGSFASPNYTDTLRSGSATWVANPYANWGYVIQVRLVLQTDSGGHAYESINGIAGDHLTAAQIGGTQIGNQINDTISSTAWVTVPNATAGTVGLRDWLNNAGGVGGSAFTGDILVQYRYQ